MFSISYARAPSCSFSFTRGSSAARRPLLLLHQGHRRLLFRRDPRKGHITALAQARLRSSQAFARACEAFILFSRFLFLVLYSFVPPRIFHLTSPLISALLPAPLPRMARSRVQRAGRAAHTHAHILPPEACSSLDEPFFSVSHFRRCCCCCLPACSVLLAPSRAVPCFILFLSLPLTWLFLSSRLSISSFRASSLYFLFLAVGFRVLSLSPRCSPCPEWKERAPLRSSFLRSVLSRSLLLLFFCLSRRLACLTAAARRRVLLSRPQRPVLSSPRFPRRAVAVGKS